MRHCRDPS